jgi:hypothetical protein
MLGNDRVGLSTGVQLSDGVSDQDSPAWKRSCFNPLLVVTEESSETYLL